MLKLDKQIRQKKSLVRQKKEQLAQIENSIFELERMSRLLQREIKQLQKDIHDAGKAGAAEISPLLESITVRRKNIMSSLRTLNKLNIATSFELEEAMKELKFLESRK